MSDPHDKNSSATPRTNSAQFVGVPEMGRGPRYMVEADFGRQLERELAEANARIAAAKTVLQSACDRDWKDETFEQTVNITANGMHWRLQRAEAAERQACAYEKRTTYSFASAPSATKPPEGYKLVRADVLAWLHGEAAHPTDGVWFERPEGAGAFWWRSKLRAATLEDFIEDKRGESSAPTERKSP